MNSYSEANPPRRGTARRIWRAFEAAGFKVAELHHNPNCWGRGTLKGWGTWACKALSPEGDWFEHWCLVRDGVLYLQGSGPPFAVWRVGEVK
jgi:hypothetical protein